jgi:predicted ArsR family transcriptional regulator
MKIEFIGNDDSVLLASRRLSRCSADNCVSAADLAGELELDEVSVLAHLEQLIRMTELIEEARSKGR